MWNSIDSELVRGQNLVRISGFLLKELCATPILRHSRIERSGVMRAERVKKVPPYLFAQIDKAKENAISRGIDVISLGVGDPDLATPKYIIDELKTSADLVENHHYPPYEGLSEFREAAADWYRRRFNVNADPDREVYALIGVKEGLIHAFLALIDPGDVTLVMDPSYPIFEVGTFFAGGETYHVPLFEKNGYLPDLKSVPGEVLARAKVIALNYPHNPTSAVAPLDFYERAVRFARENGLLLINDAVYSELYFSDSKPPSVLQVEGAMDCCVEFHSLSKTFNMTGWRIGFAIGNSTAIDALSVVKTNTDSGVFRPIQIAAAKALKNDLSSVDYLRDIYRKRRDLVLSELGKVGVTPYYPEATFYVWSKLPWGESSAAFCETMLERSGVILGPGLGWGQYGEGYFRIALTVGEDLLRQALDRLCKAISEGP
jgi:LL-diaminopimelate aminotransferase